jgi:transglutaminase-like putative cysteine protease
LKRIIIILLILMGAAVGAAAQETDGRPPVVETAQAPDIPGMYTDTWYKLIFMNQEAGYMNVSQYISNWEDTPVIVQYTETCLSLQRYSQKMESRTRIITILTYDLKPLVIIYEQEQPFSKPLYRKAAVTGSALAVFETGANGTRNTTLQLPEDFALDFQMNLKMLQDGLTPGWKRSYTTYNITSKSFDRTELEVLARKQVEFDGKKLVVTPVHNIVKSAGMSLDAVEWLDAEYNSLYLEEKTTGLRLERTTQEQALQSGARLNLDAFSVAADKKIPHSEKTAFLKLKVSFDSKEGAPPFPEDDRQRFTARDKGGLLEVTSRPFTEADSPALPLTVKGEGADYLGSNDFLQSDDPRIAELAQGITANETNAWRACIKISAWVRKNIKPSLRMAMLSAGEVLDKKEGDCTEYAVLFAALARAAGIPARVNVGLVYYNNRFLFHAWDEVYLGRWVPIDAALDQTRVDATHIKIFSGSLDSAEDLYAAMIRVVGKLKFEVLEYRDK